MRKASGKFVLRTGVRLHESLKNSAKTAKLSLNEYCIKTLSLPSGAAHYDQQLYEALVETYDLFQEELTAVVLYGSWARCQQTENSDIDFFVVLGCSSKIDRSLYKKWDNRLESIVQPNFVALPKESDSVTGIWAEVALEGIVLYEKAFLVSRYLSFVRQLIVQGRLIRKTSHGQRYWVHTGVA